MNLVLTGIFLMVFVHEVLFWTYYWQLKEYRLDRFVDGLKTESEKIVVNSFDLRKWFRPKMTMRAALMLLATSACGFWGRGSGLVLVIVAPILVSVIGGAVAPIFIVLKKRKVGMAMRKMDKYGGVVIGVTGSYGKSSTKELIRAILKQKYKVASTPKNNNSEIGVAEFVLGLKGDEEVLVVEMGAYKIGEIKAICNIVHPKIGVITGVGDQHLSLFGSLENIKRAKYELVEALPRDGKAFIADKDFLQNEVKDVVITKNGVKFGYKRMRFKVPILGRGLVRNVIGAIKVGEYLGMGLKEISKGLGGLDKNNFYPKLRELGELAVIDDSYNSSLESFLSLIDYVSVWRGYRKILVTSGMMELGERASADHEEVGKKLGEFGKVIVTNNKHLKEMNGSGNVEYVGSVGGVIRAMKMEISGKTLVVFKGRVPKAVIDSVFDK